MKCVFNLLDPRVVFEPFSHGKKYVGANAEISKQWDTQKLGFHLETLAPGAYSCPYHLHYQEEEMFIVLKGCAMVRQDEEFYEINEGDLVLFKTGSAHQFYNHTTAPLLFLALSNKAEDEICEYSDSDKRWERKTKTLTQGGAPIEDYWKDEEHPDLKW